MKGDIMPEKLPSVNEFQRILTMLETDHKQYMVIARTRWRPEEDRRDATSRLAKSVATAEKAASTLVDTTDPELRRLFGKLTIEATIAGHTLKNPSVLQR
jgi:hypothetical protein